MSGKQKALLIVLAVALVVLFVIAVGVNTGKDDGNPNKSNGFVDWLHKIGGGTSAIDPATVSASCNAVSGQPNTYQYTNLQPCVLTVAKPDGIKSLILASATTFHVEAPAPRDADFTVGADVEPSPSPGGSPTARTSVAIDKETQVVLTCPAAACIVTVEKS
jgi:hypothetical protein